jgi:CheY-like chemotaxis protein
MSKLILVVDPSSTVQAVLSTCFGNAGHRTITRSTVQEALNTLTSLYYAPDMIFLAMDQKKEAYKVIAYIKEHEAYTNTSIIGMGKQEEQAGLERTLGASRMSYLVRPFHMQDVERLVSVPLPGAAASSGTGT